MLCDTRLKMALRGNKTLFWLSFTGLIVLIISLLFGFIFFDLIIDDLIYKNVRLVDGTDQYGRWEELPLDVSYKVYMYNISNSENVANFGDYPIVEEKGPYVYTQSRKKENITYDEETDTLTYTELMHFEFNQELSGTYTEDDKVIMANVIQNVIFQMISRMKYGKYFTKMVVRAWPQMFKDTDTLFHEVRVGDILLDGYKFCDPEHVKFLSRIVCYIIRSMNLEVIEVDSDGSLKFGFLLYKQDRYDGVYTVNAGIDDVQKLGLISTWNGRSYLDNWDGEFSTCNRIHGRDSTIYPPYIKEQTFTIFATELCRTAEIDYVGEGEIRDIKGQRRELRQDTFSVSGEGNECFCLDSTYDLYGNQTCLPDGFFDLESCLGAPLVGSYPHFLFDAGEYKDTVIGLSPKRDLHLTYVLMEPRTGSPLAGYKRLQFNLFLRPLEGINVTENLTPTVMPLLWVEEGAELNDEYADLLKDLFLTPLLVVEIFKWILIGVSAALFVICGCWYLFTMNR